MVKRQTFSRWINIKKGFFREDRYPPVRYFLKEVPIAMLLEETDGYRMVVARGSNTKRTHSLLHTT